MTAFSLHCPFYFHKVFKSWMKLSLHTSTAIVSCWVVYCSCTFSVRWSWVVKEAQWLKKRVLFTSQLLEILLKGESSTHFLTYLSIRFLHSCDQQLHMCWLTALQSLCQMFIRSLSLRFFCAPTAKHLTLRACCYCHSNLPNNIRFLFHRASGVK